MPTDLAPPRPPAGLAAGAASLVFIYPTGPLIGTRYRTDADGRNRAAS